MNERLGNINFIVENTGLNTLWLEFREFVGVANTPVAASGYVNLGAALQIVPGGTASQALSVLSEQIGLFGSGNTTANVSCVFRNPADRRGAQIDIVVVGRVGWGTDPAFPVKAYRPNWGSPPDRPDIAPTNQ
ncbi:MAG: hypothetical protein PHS14_21440 [Elusimicrobia bacterium]|nr:hypothetical protein [Elusimicrobiota bacterium]